MMSFSSVFLVLIVSVLARESGVSAQCDAQAKCISDITTLRDNVNKARLAVINSEQILDKKITSCSFKCPAGFTQVPGVTKCIQVVQESLGWDAGQKRCATLNASSVAIENKAENDFIMSHIKALYDAGKNPPQGYYTGGRREDWTCSSKFVWVTASGIQHDFTFTNWHPANPSCTGGNEPCVHLLNAPESFLWNDVGCGAATWVICQITA